MNDQKALRLYVIYMDSESIFKYPSDKKWHAPLHIKNKCSLE